MLKYQIEFSVMDLMRQIAKCLVVLAIFNATMARVWIGRWCVIALNIVKMEVTNLKIYATIGNVNSMRYPAVKMDHAYQLFFNAMEYPSVAIKPMRRIARTHAKITNSIARCNTSAFQKHLCAMAKWIVRVCIYINLVFSNILRNKQIILFTSKVVKMNAYASAQRIISNVIQDDACLGIMSVMVSRSVLIYRMIGIVLI